ncbi:hypothetical protein CR513_07984, partial [Mucuna pruriens]
MASSSIEQLLLTHDVPTLFVVAYAHCAQVERRCDHDILSNSFRKAFFMLGHDSRLRFFQELKNQLTSTPILQAPNWELPFELMCDASNSALGVVLG